MMKPRPFSIEEETKVTSFQNQSPTLTYKERDNDENSR